MENDTIRNPRLYVLTEDGTIPDIQLVFALAEHTVEQCGELSDLGFGNAYNMPDYLLDAIGNDTDTSIVVAWDTEGDLPHPRCLVGEEEIRELIEALEAEPDGDSWEIARRVNLRIRSAE